ncbi:hypothetical protein D9M71_740650 [compost metagenome]
MSAIEHVLHDKARHAHTTHDIDVEVMKPLGIVCFEKIPDLEYPDIIDQEVDRAGLQGHVDQALRRPVLRQIGNQAPAGVAQFFNRRIHFVRQ